MLWGKRLKVFTDHNNLVRDALGLTSDRVYCWCLILEEYGPEIIYIKGEDNIVADAMSRLEYDPEINVKKLHMSQRCKILIKLFRACAKTRRGGIRNKYVNSHIKTVSSISDDLKATDIVNNFFSNISEEEDAIYPLLLLKSLRRIVK